MFIGEKNVEKYNTKYISNVPDNLQNSEIQKCMNPGNTTNNNLITKKKKKN